MREEPSLTDIGRKHHKTPAQVLIRWHIYTGLVVIPKSSHPERIAQNIDVFDLALDQHDINKIDNFETGVRVGADPDSVNFKVSAGLYAAFPPSRAH